MRGSLGALARLAASLAFAICSRKACDELTFGGDSSSLEATSERRAALAFANCSRSAVDEAETFLLVTGVVLLPPKADRAGKGVAAVAVPGGDIAWPKVSARDARALGVRTPNVLLFDKGRALAVD